jgi:hypothetical protein
LKAPNVFGLNLFRLSLISFEKFGLSANILS